jgi:hypothetical protein
MSLPIDGPHLRREAERLLGVEPAELDPPPWLDGPSPDPVPDPVIVPELAASKRSNGGGAHAAGEGPTAAEPLRGLAYLGPLAVVGRSRILALAAEPVQYVWRDIAVAGTIVVVAGAPGEGKTTLLFLALAARATTGEAVELLGRRVEPAPAGQYVVLIEAEHSAGSASRKLVRSLALLGIDDSALDRIIIVARAAVRLGSPAWGDVERMVAAGIVSDIALDTVARVAPSDANDEREQVAIFDTVASTIETGPAGRQPTAWAVAHTRKNGTSGDLSDVSGSTQRTGQADSVLMLRAERVDGRVASARVTFAKLREDPDEYPAPVTFAIEGGRLSTAATPADTDDRPLETRILELLALGPRPKRALRDALHRSDRDVEQALTNLFAGRDVETTTITIAGRPRKAFRRREGGARPSSREVPDESR